MVRLGKLLLVCFFLFSLTLRVYSKPIILFVHGLAAGFEKWDPLIRKNFESHSTIRYTNSDTLVYFRDINFGDDTDEQFDVWNVSYYTHNIAAEMMFGNLDLYAQRLDNICKKITQITGNNKFKIIAHSMGGLVSRKMMVMSKENWDSVEKLLTVGTPNHGVNLTLGLWGQLYDLNSKNSFITNLNKQWLLFNDSKDKWGVIGGVNKKIRNRHTSPHLLTDSGGPGFVSIFSSIPFNESEQALTMFDEVAYNTDHFSFRLLTYGNHLELLDHYATQKGLEWVLED